MRSLIERLPARIQRLEAEHGSDDPFVQQLKEQLRASIATAGKSAETVFTAQAVEFPVDAAEGEPKR